MGPSRPSCPVLRRCTPTPTPTGNGGIPYAAPALPTRVLEGLHEGEVAQHVAQPLHQHVMVVERALRRGGEARVCAGVVGIDCGSASRAACKQRCPRSVPAAHRHSTLTPPHHLPLSPTAPCPPRTLASRCPMNWGAVDEEKKERSNCARPSPPSISLSSPSVRVATSAQTADVWGERGARVWARVCYRAGRCAAAQRQQQQRGGQSHGATQAHLLSPQRSPPAPAAACGAQAVP